MSRKLILVLAAGALLLLLVWSGVALAQDFGLAWWTMDGGGETYQASAGGQFTLGGTIGQPDAGLLAGGPYTLGGGFWAGGALRRFGVYLPVMVRGW